MPTININGLDVEAQEGTSVLQAAAAAGIEIPHYCYHPGLHVVGSCRMCQVEIAGIPKLQVACNTPIKDGMVVTTNNEKVCKAQNAVLEFLLVNHPLDCPVCDQAGECGLQDYYMRFGRNGSRLADNKLKRAKAKPIGPFVILDQDRCVLCSRCIRFCQEISKTSELGIFNRGDHSVVDIYPGRELTNKYSGNVVDICPVGALTDRDFRFQVRVWYLRQGDSVCTGCSRGCNISAYYNPARRHHAGGRRVVRLKPRFNKRVNQWWMCDEGRYNYRFFDERRIQQPVRRHDNTIQQLSWKEALPEIASQLRAVLDSRGAEAVAVLASPQMPNEDLYLAGKLFQDLGIRQCAFGNPADKPGTGDDFLITPDKNPNRRGAKAAGWSEWFEGDKDIKALAAAGTVKALVVFRQDLGGVFSAEELSELAKKLDLFVYIGTNGCATADAAHYLLPCCVHLERDGTFTNVDGWVQRFFRVVPALGGEAQPDWQIVNQLAGALGLDYRFRRCEDVFNQMAASQPEFSGLTYSAMGKQGASLAS